MKKLKLILVIAVALGFIAYGYIYQDHRDIESEAPEFVLSSDKIASLFSENPSASEQKFLNKTVEVSGLISEVNSNEITIDDKVFCQFTENISNTIKPNSNIKIKGRVIGYDDLLEQVKLDQCAIIE